MNGYKLQPFKNNKSRPNIRNLYISVFSQEAWWLQLRVGLYFYEWHRTEYS